MLAAVQLRVVEVAAGGVPAVLPRAANLDLLLEGLTRVLRGLRDPVLATRPPPDATLAFGARIPGTSCELQPASAAAWLGMLMHVDRPAAVDVVAPALAVADHLARRAPYEGFEAPRIADLCGVLERAAALHVALAQDPRCGTDPWLASRVAGTWAAALLLGADESQWRDAVRCAALDDASAADIAPLFAMHPAMRLDTDSHTDAGATVCRRAAGENAARAVRHARAACGEAAPTAPAVGTTARRALQPAAAALNAEFAAAARAALPERRVRPLLALFDDPSRLAALGVDACIARLVCN